MMARSFIESHLILNESAESPVINSITQGLDYLIKNNKMDVRKPSQEEIEKQNDFIVLDEAVSVEGLVKSFCKSRGATPRHIAKLIGRVKSMLSEDEDYDAEYINGLIELEYPRTKKL